MFELSTKTVETIFKSHFDTTIHQYAIRKKLDMAKYYLEFFPQMKIIDISINLGFYDEYHFSRLFKSRFGMSPTGYRKNISNTEHIACK